MDDNTNSDIVKSASEAFPQTVKQADEALSTVFGLFNTLMLPFRMANLFAQQKWEKFKKDMEHKTATIPAENLQSPPLLIAGPTLEALKYAYDEAELRDMYENLLTSAMDTRRVGRTHPAYVDTIKQMSPLDAQVLKKIVETHNRLRCVTIEFTIPDTNDAYVDGMPLYYVSELSDMADSFAISASLTNLKRLALIDIESGGIRGANYEVLLNDKYVAYRMQPFTELCKRELGKELRAEIVERYYVNVNDYGKNFSAVCM